MLISPLMGPIMGIGLSLGIMDLSLLRKSLYNFLFAVFVSLATSTIYFLISPINAVQSELLARTSPNIYDVLIAFLGGLAGIVAVSSKHKGNVIPGVAIATALMPPLCTAGFGLATLNMNFLFGAFYLFFINSVFIAWATYITVKILKFPKKSFQSKEAESRAVRIVAAIVIVTIVPSIYFAYIFRQKMEFEVKAKNFIYSGAELEGNYLLNSEVLIENNEIKLVYGGKGLTKEQNDSLFDRLNQYGLSGSSLQIKQGISVIERKKIEGQLGEIRSALDKKDMIISELSMKADSTYQLETLSSQLTTEAFVNFPSIEKIIVSRLANGQDTISASSMAVFVKTGSSLKTAEREKFTKWLGVRLGNIPVEIAFTK